MLKKMIFSFVFTFLFVAGIVSADAIPLDSHSVDRCVQFVNMSNFPDLVLIGYVVGPMVDTYEAYKVEERNCLDMGYKFNQLSIYWTTKEKFAKLDLKNLDIADLNLLLEEIHPYGGYVGDMNPLSSELIEYSIAGFSGKKLIAYKSKHISKYNNGQADKVEVFGKPNINTETLNKSDVDSNINNKDNENNINNTKNINLEYNNDQLDEIEVSEEVSVDSKDFNTESTDIDTNNGDDENNLNDVENLNNEGFLSRLQNFWSNIVCFFKSLFGRNC